MGNGGVFMQYSLASLFILFILYSFLGWCMEVLATLYTTKKLVNRGFLIGPICPIYGNGCLMIILLLHKYLDDPFVLFAMATLICSILEYFTSYIMEKLFKARWWDYSDKKYNLNGRICLENLVAFGVLGLVMMYLINPFFTKILGSISEVVLNSVAICLFVIYAVDNIISYNVINSFKKAAGQIRKDNTEEITKKVKEILLSRGGLYKRLVSAFNFEASEKLIKDITARVKNETMKAKKKFINELDKQRILFDKEKAKEQHKVFSKIDKYLSKKGHIEYASILLCNYNGNNIYVRFDYDDVVKAYKVVWVDLNFIDLKHLDNYVNIQTMTSYLANKVVKILANTFTSSANFSDDKIYGDRVVVTNIFDGIKREYVFDRFLPEELDFLSDFIVILFSYLPRGMDVILNEMFGLLDGMADKYNVLKPVKFDLFKTDMTTIFKSGLIKKGQKEYDKGKVAFLEQLEGKYVAIVDDKEPCLVILHQINDDFAMIWCNCENPLYCEHICAVLLALRDGCFNNFYKVKYRGQDKSLLDEVRDGFFYCCFGIEGDNLLLVADDGMILKAPILENGRCMFDVIEDDDECSLSKELENYKK